MSKRELQFTAEMNDDFFRTVYGGPRAFLRAEGKLFDHRITIDLAFWEGEDRDNIWSVSLSVPLGQITCSETDWIWLQQRIARALSQTEGRDLRPASWPEMMDFVRRQRVLAEQKWFMTNTPEGMA